jgi:hypothetical protein
VSDLPTDPQITRPDDLAGASLRELLDAWHSHVAPLVDARCNIGDLPAARLARHALAALAAGQALTDELMALRWVTVCDALRYGAPMRHVAGAMGLDVDEVAAGLRSWADGQHLHSGMPVTGRDEVYALAAKRQQ